MKQLPRKSFFYITLALALAFTTPTLRAQTALPTGSGSTAQTLPSAGEYDLDGDYDFTGTTEAYLATNVGTTTIDINANLTTTGEGIKIANVGESGPPFTLAYDYVVNIAQGASIVASDRRAIDYSVSGNVHNQGEMALTVDNQGTLLVTANPSGEDTFLTSSAAIDTSGGKTGALVTDPTDPTYFTQGGLITNGAGTLDSSGNPVTVTNGSALIQSDTDLAIQMGRNQTLNNWGTILSDTPINDNGKNNSFLDESPGSNDIGRGVELSTAGDIVNNYGTITGSEDGVDDSNSATGIYVNNWGTITGNNGSGVSSDSTGVLATNEVVTNHVGGKIIANNAALNGGQIIDQTNLPSIDSDPDGIDIDGGATIYNSGLIQTTGVAAGFDARGRANKSDGMAIGGGNVFNYGTGQIIGAQNGVTVNNDSVAGRSGSTALNLENDGLIQGQDGYAIRSENKPTTSLKNGVNSAGLSVDNDTVVNTGTIIGGSTAVDPSQDIALEGTGGEDKLASGVENGVTYYAAGTKINNVPLAQDSYAGADGVLHVGNARLIDGDGSAIQLGQGNDVLANTGTITGLAGKAINMEDGDDTVNIEQGSAITGDIDGGNGSEVAGDTLNLDTDDTLGLHELSTDGTADGTAITYDSSKGDTFTFASAIVNFEHVNARSGKTILTGNSTYNGETIIGGGSSHARLEQDGTHTETNGATGALDYHVENNGTLAGSGTVTLATAATLVTVDQGGTFAPGSTTGPGKFTLAQGSVAMNGEMDFRLDGTTAGTGYDQFSLLNGTFTLGATSTLGLSLGYDPTAGDSFTLIDNEGTSAIAGNFAGLAQGADFDAAGQEFSISYTGGDGNDVVLTDLGAVPEPSTWALMLGSAGFLILLARRKLNAQA